MSDYDAYCPGSISFLFKQCPHKDVIQMGSVGVGCTIDQGVFVRATSATSNQIIFNGEHIDFPTVSFVASSLTSQPLQIEISTPLPLGYGFGVSGASALATAFATNKRLSLGKQDKELYELAHTAEILHKTGLGTVGTQTHGGFLLKTSPGLYFEARELPFIGTSLYATIIGKIETPNIIGDSTKISEISLAADHAMNTLLHTSSPTLDDVVDVSYHYAVESNLLSTEINTLLQKFHTEGIHATIPMLGNVILSTEKPTTTPYPLQTYTISHDTIRYI